MIIFLLLSTAYLIGSVSFAVLLSRGLGLPDPRTRGSKNAGATNAWRVGGSKLGAIVALADLSKGMAPLLIAQSFLPDLQTTTLAWLILACVVGHCYPLFFGFRGGKGVLTALGGLLILAPWLSLSLAITWLALVAYSRHVSLASITATLLMPVYAVWSLPAATHVPLVIMSLFIFARHSDNVRRLRLRQEPKIPPWWWLRRTQQRAANEAEH